jgi:hypothetical protein
MLALTFPLVPEIDTITGSPFYCDDNGKKVRDKAGNLKAPEPLFHTMERNYNSSDNQNEFLFLTWENRESLAKSVIKILPALVFLALGELPDRWFREKQADRIIDQVTFLTDPDTGEWTGDWITDADTANAAMVTEDMPGMSSVQIENLAAILAEAEEARTDTMAFNTDDMSGGTSVGSEVFQAELGIARPNLEGSPSTAETNPTPTTTQAPSTAPTTAAPTQGTAQLSLGSDPAIVQGNAVPPVTGVTGR